MASGVRIGCCCTISLLYYRKHDYLFSTLVKYGSVGKNHLISGNKPWRKYAPKQDGTPGAWSCGVLGSLTGMDEELCNSKQELCHRLEWVLIHPTNSRCSSSSYSYLPATDPSISRSTTPCVCVCVFLNSNANSRFILLNVRRNWLFFFFLQVCKVAFPIHVGQMRELSPFPTFALSMQYLSFFSPSIFLISSNNCSDYYYFSLFCIELSHFCTILPVSHIGSLSLIFVSFFLPR